jgi:signal transduction histidine kinase
VDRSPGLTEEGTRWFWLWDVYLALVYLGVVTIVLLRADSAAVARFGTIAALSAIIPLYGWFGRPVIVADDHGWRSKIFVAATLALVMTAATLEPATSYSMFAVTPMIFMSLRVFPAVLVVATALFIPAFATLINTGFDRHVLVTMLPAWAIGVAFSVLVGLWIDRVLSQSESRGALIRQLEASQAEVARLSHETGVAGERERLAGEIHDTLAQGFTSIATLVQAAESELGRDETLVRKHLALVLRTARENLTESRALVAALAPAELTESSVADAIQRQAARLTEETGVAVTFIVQGDRRPLPTALDVVLLRTVQESLSNVRKHAEADSVEIVLSYQDSTVVLLVTDNGHGFDVDRSTGGFGLRGMRSRVEHVGGSLSVSSAPGAGTTVELEVCA